MRVKVVIDLIEHDVVDFYRLSAAVEHQPEFIIIEINLVQEDIDNGAAVKGIIEVALLEHGQEVCDLLCGYDALLLGFNGQLSLQFGFFFLPLAVIRSMMVSTPWPFSRASQRFSMAVSIS